MKKRLLDPEEITRNMYSAINSHDAEAFISYHTEDVLLESIADATVIQGKEALKEHIEEYASGFSGFRMELTSMFTRGDRQFEEWEMSGTHTGTFRGFPATGKSFTLRGITVRELKGEKTSRVSNYYDSASFLRQLGIPPQTLQK